MIKTEGQRRWWFANHPEYSAGRDAKRNRNHTPDESGAERKVSPEEVDAYVDSELPHLYGTEADFLKLIKRHFGTEGSQPMPSRMVASADESFVPGDKGPKNRQPEKREATFLDAVRKGFDDELRRWGISGLGGALRSNSAKLAKNMIRAGKPRPPDHAAHHIIPEYDKRFPEAEQARKILNRWKIDIHGADNGVWLPYKRDIGKGAYHRAIHGGEYYRKVHRLMRKAKSRDHAIRILKQIGRQLSDNTFLP